MKRILLVDSDPVARRPICDRLAADGHVVLEFESAAQASASPETSVDAILLCHAQNSVAPENTIPGQMPAVQALRELSGLYAGVPVIVVCSTAEETLHALRQGAYYVTRPPLGPDEASLLVSRALSEDERMKRVPESAPAQSMIRLNPVLATAQKASESGADEGAVMIGESAKMKAIRRVVERLGERPTTTVLITGESGSGKDTIARVLHAQTSQGGRFIDISNLNAPEAALESLLFGVEAAGEEVRPGLLEQ
ncbi:MAG TPA: sigma 54-interacting transcriptional regulator, partial [Polyangiaceae bacterium]|nr:sigma 54-interacting transcriptional regulator [Polyangiaceae bacterium]